MSPIVHLVAGLAALGGVNAHSWVEQMRVISNGTYTGHAGYMRGYNPRGPGFADAMNQNLIPALTTGRTRINGSDLLCKSTQATANQTEGFPKLSASPGDYVALRYLENGHVTLPQNQLGKPGSGGTVMVYATSDPKDDERLVDVLQWNTNGTGGDKRGKLLTVQNFDDGRCYQINSSPKSQQRQQEFPNKPLNAPAGTANEELWCETDIKIPDDTVDGKDLTLYWAWQWDTQPNVDPGLPDGKDEWYTSCMDVNMIASGQISKASLPTPNQLLVQDPQRQANAQFTERAANVTLPDGGPDGGDGNLGNSASSSSAAVSPNPASASPVPTTALSAGALPSGASFSLIPIPDASGPPSGSQAAPTAAPASSNPSPCSMPPAPAQGSGVSGTGSPHTLTLTQVMTITTNFKRSVETVTTEVINYSAIRGRNPWA